MAARQCKLLGSASPADGLPVVGTRVTVYGRYHEIRRQNCLRSGLREAGNALQKAASQFLTEG